MFTGDQYQAYLMQQLRGYFVLPTSGGEKIRMFLNAMNDLQAENTLELVCPLEISE